MGCCPVLIDDIISSAHTMAVAVRQVRSVFGCAPVCIGVHAVFDSDAMQVLEDAGAARVVTCSTLPNPNNGIDVMGEVALAVRTTVGSAPG